MSCFKIPKDASNILVTHSSSILLHYLLTFKITSKQLRLLPVSQSNRHFPARCRAYLATRKCSPKSGMTPTSLPTIFGWHFGKAIVNHSLHGRKLPPFLLKRLRNRSKKFEEIDVWIPLLQKLVFKRSRNTAKTYHSLQRKESSILLLDGM